MLKIKTKISVQNKNGHRKLKSHPRLAAQKVKRVRLTTITEVRRLASIMIFPVKNIIKLK